MEGWTEADEVLCVPLGPSYECCASIAVKALQLPLLLLFVHCVDENQRQLLLRLLV